MKICNSLRYLDTSSPNPCRHQPTTAPTEAVRTALHAAPASESPSDTRVPQSLMAASGRLTSENPSLKRHTTAPLSPLLTMFAINCKTDLTPAVSGYVAESLAPATRSGYLSDLSRFRGWGGSVPASEASIAAYIASHAQTHAAATLARWLASISKAHRASSAVDPTKSELVKATLRGIRRIHGVPHHQATALLREDLFMVLDAMGG